MIVTARIIIDQRSTATLVLRHGIVALPRETFHRQRCVMSIERWSLKQQALHWVTDGRRGRLQVAVIGFVLHVTSRDDGNNRRSVPPAAYLM